MFGEWSILPQVILIFVAYTKDLVHTNCRVDFLFLQVNRTLHGKMQIWFRMQPLWKGIVYWYAMSVWLQKEQWLSKRINLPPGYCYDLLHFLSVLSNIPKIFYFLPELFTILKETTESSSLCIMKFVSFLFEKIIRNWQKVKQKRRYMKKMWKMPYSCERLRIIKPLFM